MIISCLLYVFRRAFEHHPECCGCRFPADSSRVSCVLYYKVSLCTMSHNLLKSALQSGHK